jgi:hypothetical protein
VRPAGHDDLALGRAGGLPLADLAIAGLAVMAMSFSGILVTQTSSRRAPIHAGRLLMRRPPQRMRAESRGLLDDSKSART